MSKVNGKMVVVDHAEVLIDEYVMAEVKMLQEYIDQYRQNQFQLEQQQMQITQQIMESQGGVKAFEILRDQKIRDFASENNIEDGKWKLDLVEGKFIKS